MGPSGSNDGGHRVDSDQKYVSTVSDRWKTLPGQRGICCCGCKRERGADGKLWLKVVEFEELDQLITLSESMCVSLQAIPRDIRAEKC